MGQALLALMPAANATQVCSVMQQSVFALKATATLESKYSTCSGLLSTTLWLICVVVQAYIQAYFIISASCRVSLYALHPTARIAL